MPVRSLVAMAAPVLVLTFASVPSQAEERTLALIEWSCTQQSGAREDSRKFMRCMEETARQMLVSTAPRQPYGMEIISGEVPDNLSDQMADAS